MPARGGIVALLSWLLRLLAAAARVPLRWTRQFLRWWAQKAPGIFYSFWLHFFVLVSLIGLPLSCQKDLPQQNVISVELLPVKDKTNVKPKPEPVGKKPKEKPKPPEPEKEKPKPKPAPEPKPEPAPKPEAVPSPKPVVKPKPVEKPKPKPAPEEEKLDFDTVLKSVEKLKEKKQQEPQQTESDDKLKFPDSMDFKPAEPLSMSEIDAIKRQISQCWSIPAGARDALDMSVRLSIALRRDGSLTKVDIVEKARYSDPADPFYKAAADAAVRAVRQCSPLKGLPPEKYNSWKEIELNFDPREMLY